nr:uncharacterized protein LOC111424344 [Onthophagus taurus]
MRTLIVIGLVYLFVLLVTGTSHSHNKKKQHKRSEVDNDVNGELDETPEGFEEHIKRHGAYGGYGGPGGRPPYGGGRPPYWGGPGGRPPYCCPCNNTNTNNNTVF